MIIGIFSSSMLVSSALPVNTVVFDDNKAFSMDLFFQDSISSEIIDSISNSNYIWFDVEGSGFLDAFTGEEMTQAQKDSLNNIEYTNANNEKSVYQNFDDSTPVEDAGENFEIIGIE